MKRIMLSLVLAVLALSACSRPDQEFANKQMTAVTVEVGGRTVPCIVALTQGGGAIALSCDW